LLPAVAGNPVFLSMGKEASYYELAEDKHIRCLLCPHQCLIPPEGSGLCRVRINRHGMLRAASYGQLSALQSDPVEKKPLYHFFPGRMVLSAGSYGCNLRCLFCQNHEISQRSVIQENNNSYDPAELLDQLKSLPGNIGLAYTYNEPVVFFEWVYDMAEMVRLQGLQNIMISNGYINTKPLDKLIDIIDCFNIDLKFFNEESYRKFSGASLQPVLSNLKLIRASGAHLEITHLVVSGMNDNEKEFSGLIQWVRDELGANTPLHISRSFPRFRSSSPPPSESKMLDFYQLAYEKLDYVYLGNLTLEGKSDTLCPNCKRLVVSRHHYACSIHGLDGKGNCSYCGTSVAIR
jgi:pyruvate formate lyase activating enzyme